MSPAHPFRSVGEGIAELLRAELRRCGHTIDEQTALYVAERIRQHIREKVL